MAQSCARCARENPDGARFCMECGAPLERRCPSCGEPAPTDARFCMACGHALSESGAILRPEATRPAEPPPEERRQVTVLFADLSGYTAVAETMDPEALKALVDRCLRRLGQEVTDYGGTVDKYIGDNIMALFGAPVAHEDDTERAVRAGLGMLGSMGEINEGLEREYGVTFDLRIGVNTGEVLAGAMGGSYTVMGDTVNVASRLQAAARPGSVTVGPRTYEATVGVVDYRELQPLELKGKAEPVQAWEAISLRAARPVRRGGLRESPLVGRADELKLLESLYDRVERERRPHLVTMLGEAGVGKSRMLRELRECLGKREQVPGFHEGRCLPYGSGIVYWALGEVIRAEFDVRDTDPSDVAWHKLADGVEQLLAANGVREEPASRHATRIARLLGVDIPPDVELAEEDDPERMREGYFSAVRTMVEAMAADRPLVLAFEDIHWADQGMLDLIEYIAAWVRGPLLLLCLTRDELFERRPNWGSGRRNTTSIVLDPLDRQETSRLVSALLGNPDFATGAMAPLIAERAGGNPLFAEELVRRMEEKGDFAVTDLPDTVQALLAARLDSLETHERRLIQQAAVVGRHFWVGSLGEVNGKTERALGSLLEKDLIMPSEGAQLAGETEYAFKHVLIRDVAYATLPKSVRCRRHFEVGQFVERRAGDRIDELVALLADHYGRAASLGSEIGLPAEELAPMHAKALSFLEAAGDAATSIYSNEEAFDKYEAARGLRGGDDAAGARIAEKQGDVALRLGRVDVAVELWEGCLEHHRFQEALERVGDLHRKVGAALWHKGESKQAIEHYQRGINLLKDGPPSLELVHLYEEAASLYMRTGDNMLAIYAAEKALRLAERLGERRAAGRAHGIFGRVFGRIGDTSKARENLERSVALARDTSRTETIRALLTLGDHLETSEADYAGADRIYTEALQLAEELGDLPAQVELQAALAVLAAYRADWETAEERTESSAALAEREGLVGKLAYPYGLRGLLLWRRGDADAAVDAYKRSHEMAEQVGWSEVAYSALYGLSLVLRDRRDFSGAVTALDQALDVCERAGLVGQSILALGLRASVLRAAGRNDQAREAAEEASRLAERLPYPVGQAAALEARGAVCDDVDEAVELLEQARTRWEELGRPLDGARCTLTAGRLLAEAGSPRAQEVLERAAEDVTRLGVPHLADEARALATTSAARQRSDR